MVTELSEQPTAQSGRRWVRNLGFKGFHINLSRLSGYSVKASPWTRYIKPDFACYEEDIAPYKGELELWYIRNQSFWLDAIRIIVPELSHEEKYRNLDQKM